MWRPLSLCCPLLALLLLGLGPLWGPAPSAAQRETLNIGAIVPDHSFLRRSYNRAMSRALMSISRSPSMKLAQKFNLRGEIMFMDMYSPPELLEAFCKQILSKTMNTILYMSNTDYEGKHTASGQYVLQVSNFLGIPVIAWNGDNSGFFQVSHVLFVILYWLCLM